MPEQPPKSYLTLNPSEMKISVSTLVGLVLILSPVCLWAYNLHQSTVAGLKQYVSHEVDRATRYQWTVQDQVRWAERLQYRNPELNIPDVSEIWEWRRGHTNHEGDPQEPYLTPRPRRELAMDDPRKTEARP